jgi:hypothetical protein
LNDGWRFLGGSLLLVLLGFRHVNASHQPPDRNLGGTEISGRVTIANKDAIRIIAPMLRSQCKDTCSASIFNGTLDN